MATTAVTATTAAATTPPSHGGAVATATVLGFAVALAVVHLLADRVHALERIPRSRWLSFAGGVSVAYVFVHLLPELGASARAVERSDILLATFFERHVYLVALAGFGLFYGLERAVTRSKRHPGHVDRLVPTEGVFWLHVASFTAYNGVIGYILHERRTLASGVLFTVAMGLHFLVNDHGLRHDHERRYHDVGRWVLAAAVVGGAAVGAFVEVGPAIISVLVAFLAGGIILNVVKEELPEHRESRFWAFAAGAAGYAAVLLLV